MKSTFFFALFIILVTLSNTGFAEKSDLAIEVNNTKYFNPPNSIGSLSVTIQNLGPDTTKGSFFVSDVDPTLPASLFQPVIYTFESGPCVNMPVDVLPWDTFGAWRTPSLSAGESITCYWEFVVESKPSFDPVLVTWKVIPSEGVTTIDPDQSNNFYSIKFEFSRTPGIPLMAKPVIGILMFLILLVGFQNLGSRPN